MSHPSTVYLVDDEPDFLLAVELLLTSGGFHVKKYSSPHAFIAEHDYAIPGCVVLDLAMESMDGLSVQRALAEKHPQRPVVFLSGQSTVRASVDAMKGGAVDFLTKPLDEEVLLQTVIMAVDRDSAIRREALRNAQTQSLFNSLTCREREILEMVVAGYMNKEIAAHLTISERTVKFHRANLLEKLGVNTTIGLVRLAVAGGLGPGLEMS